MPLRSSFELCLEGAVRHLPQANMQRQHANSTLIDRLPDICGSSCHKPAYKRARCMRSARVSHAASRGSTTSSANLKTVREVYAGQSDSDTPRTAASTRPTRQIFPGRHAAYAMRHGITHSVAPCGCFAHSKPEPERSGAESGLVGLAGLHVATSASASELRPQAARFGRRTVPSRGGTRCFRVSPSLGREWLSLCASGIARTDNRPSLRCGAQRTEACA